MNLPVKMLFKAKLKAKGSKKINKSFQLMKEQMAALCFWLDI